MIKFQLKNTASYSPDVVGTDFKPLFDTIIEYIPEPEMDTEAPFQMLEDRLAPILRTRF